MKIVCAPDSFKESLCAVDVAKAMVAGISRVLPDADIDDFPVGDGGEGTLEALHSAIEGRRVNLRVHDTFGHPTDVAFGEFPTERFAFIESAAAIGLESIPEKERDVMSASSFGVGELIGHAAARKPRKLIVGVGGSASNDGGCGMAQALGVQFYDRQNKLIENPISGGELKNICRIDLSNRSPVVATTEILVAVDVNNPLSGPNGAAFVYAPQKGATPDQVGQLDEGLQNLADIIERDLKVGVRSVPGAGAAGGLGAGLFAFANAKIVSGIETILDACGFDQRIDGTDLCLTGEGRLDLQSSSGKACIGVAAAAARKGVPTIALVGSVGPGAKQCLAAGLKDYVVIGDGLTKSESIRRAETLIANAAADVAKRYSSFC